jgi:hypothetical protein
VNEIERMVDTGCVWGGSRPHQRGCHESLTVFNQKFGFGHFAVCYQ